MDSKAVTAVIVAVVVLIACARAFAGPYRYHENPALAHRVVRKYVVSAADCRTVDVSKAALTTLISDSECLVIVPHNGGLFCGILEIDAASLKVITSEQARCVDVQRYLNKLPLKDVAR